jgi:5'-deoxynucleotidase
MWFIRRWGLMHSVQHENIQEHSLRVAMIAHALGIIRNCFFGGEVNRERVAVLALYHDASEVLTGDLPRPVKYYNPEIEASYRTIEAVAREKLLAMVPDGLKPDSAALFQLKSAAVDQELVKAPATGGPIPMAEPARLGHRPDPELLCQRVAGRGSPS